MGGEAWWAPGGLRFMGSQRIGHDLATKQKQHAFSPLGSFFCLPDSPLRSGSLSVTSSFLSF